MIEELVFVIWRSWSPEINVLSWFERDNFRTSIIVLLHEITITFKCILDIGIGVLESFIKVKCVLVTFTVFMAISLEKDVHMNAG